MTDFLTAPLETITNFTKSYHDLFKDQRLRKGFDATITGILSSGTTKVSQIARTAPQTAHVPHAEKRIRRLIRKGNQRGQVSAAEINQKFLELGAQKLAHQLEVRVILDGSDLRKPYSTDLEFLSTVRALDGDLIPGYCTLNAFAFTNTGIQTLLYQKTFSPQDPSFKSERDLVHTAILEISTALRAAGVGRITWILDRGFDDEKVIAWILERHDCFVIRAQHNRNVSLEFAAKTQKLFSLLRQQTVLGSIQIKRPTLESGKHKKRLSTANTRVFTGWVNDQHLINVVGLEFTGGKPDDTGWVLLTNLPVSSFEQAQHVIALYVLRWSIEEVFAWMKTTLDWEAVQVLDFQAVRTLVAYAFVAATFVFELMEGVEPRVITFLAYLGGWMPRVGLKPGRRVLTLGLQRFFSSLLVESLSGSMQLVNSVEHVSIRDRE
jgi:Transposase DDE domain